VCYVRTPSTGPLHKSTLCGTPQPRCHRWGGDFDSVILTPTMNSSIFTTDERHRRFLCAACGTTCKPGRACAGIYDVVHLLGPLRSVVLRHCSFSFSGGVSCSLPLMPPHTRRCVVRAQTWGVVWFTDYCIQFHILEPWFHWSPLGMLHAVVFQAIIFMICIAHLAAVCSDPGSVKQHTVCGTCVVVLLSPV